ncbi:hypothetical protein ACFUCV_02455 [Specibacter sp. NPDC057265]|uniref:hypothetical protein n=1 Tax=Specibacter sp. NPDC057265 TaxID=3346075 RepID=UPI0036422508
MNQLPASYEAYLSGKNADLVATLRPVLQQSAAEMSHGVRVVITLDEVQAHADPTIPFGEIREELL